MESSATESGNLRRPATQAALSCERCRRRKIKCDRVLPACQTCLKTSNGCLYPSTSQKPGPKPGAPQRRRRRSAFRPTAQNEVTSRTTLPDSGLPSPQYEDQDATITSISTYVTNSEHEGSPSRGLTLSQLVHPSHEPVHNPLVESLSENETIGRKHDFIINDLCQSLRISPNIYHYLLHSYFDNMTAFSLFHRPSFEKKLLEISSQLQIQALIAAMFSFSSRFHNTHYSSITPPGIPSHLHFREIAGQAVDKAFKQCSDDTPSLCLLQALILTTFGELISGVRGQAWRSVGKCVRVAYELQLHFVDKDQPKTSSCNDSMEPLAEEKRRAWWAIWEFDVFASTIRRLPTAIDWTLNETWLPIEDEIWFNNSHTKSCHLDSDSSLAWKSLETSGNRSPKAWFIVVNALMRTAHVLSYPQAYPNTARGQRSPPAKNVQDGVDVLSNALYCLSAALPPQLAYQGEYLAFSKSMGGVETLQLDSARHNIHVMTQLSRFMINHYQVFDSASRQLGLVDSSSQMNQSISAINQSAWNHYLSAASEIVTLVRSCSPRHVGYVNPFLASTIWLAAAAQIVSKHIRSPSIDRRVAESNLDLLQTNLNAFVTTWGVSSALQQKLIALEARLDSFEEHIGSSRPRDFSGGEKGSGTTHSAAEPGGTWSNETRQNGTNTNSLAGLSQQAGDSTSDWSFQQGLGVAGLEFGPVMGLDMWGWGVDELLTYNGMNELSSL